MFTRYLTHCGVRSCIAAALADAGDSHKRLVGCQEFVAYLLYPYIVPYCRLGVLKSYVSYPTCNSQ